MAKARIQILIPTFNNVNELDLTMESVENQNYDPEDIYVTIVDFGSEDGTYEKILNYDRKHLGFYTRPFQKNQRQRLADAGRILEKVRPFESMGTGATYRFCVVLYPGDVMYPDCLKVLANNYIDNFGLNLNVIICESDIFETDGTVRKQKPLFDKNCIIDGRTQVEEYLNRGYMHQIFQALPRLDVKRFRGAYKGNEGRSWNKLFNRGINYMALYIHEPLVCTRRVEYEDELEEIVLRWEMYITLSILRERDYGDDFDKTMKISYENMAEYALWRSFCMYQKEKNWKDIEDCFLIASVIAPDIKKKEIYQNMEKLIVQKDRGIEDAVEQYFIEQE